MVTSIWSKWAGTWENLPSYMCAQQRLKSACASAQSDQCLRCPHEEALHPWLSEMRPVKILIRPRMSRLIGIFAGRTCTKVRPVKILVRLRECTSSSESSLGTMFEGMFSDAAIQIWVFHNLSLKAPYSSKMDILLSKKGLIYNHKTWHLAACKISIIPSWNKMIFYHISVLMLPTLIQRYDENHFVFDPVQCERLTEILQAVRCHI